jgi:GxxExxY protein
MAEPVDTMGGSAEPRLKHWDLTDRIIRVFFDVYNELGSGFLESVYEEAICLALAKAALDVQRQVPVPIWFRGQKIGQFYADLMVNRSVLVELKVAKCLGSSHYAQLMHYLKATPVEVGLLLNFGSRAEFKRLVFANERKLIRENPRESAVGVPCA